MFKSATILKITLPQPMLLGTLEKSLQNQAFTPIGASQESSVGWAPARGVEHGALVESVGGQLIMRLMTETKTVPAQAIADRVAAQVAHIEETTGRKPGKKETRELKEDARQALLPSAFARRASVLVWIDPMVGLLVIDSSSQSRADAVTMMLVRSIDGATIQLRQTVFSPGSMMTQWLALLNEQDASERNGFDVNRACQLKANDETKAVVTYKKHILDTDEVRQHIRQGKTATRLALTYDDRLSFTLTDAGVLTGITFLDIVFEDRADEASDVFDAGVIILTGELSKLIKALTDALGGVLE